jgi:lipoprotein-anchoring transpeptidase ErfK/SrfK
MKNVLDTTKKPAAKPKKSAEAKEVKKAEAHKPRRRWIIASAAAAVILALVASTGLAVAHYNDKILPGVSVAGVNLGGKTKAEASVLLAQRVAKLDVTIQDGATSWKPTAAQLGVAYNIPATIQAAYAEGRSGSVGQRFGALSGVTVPLTYTYNSAATDAFISTVVHATSKQPTDAALTVKGGTVQIVPETVGATTGVENAKQQVQNALARPGALSLSVSAITLHPNITAADLATPLSSAQALANLPVTITNGAKNIGPSQAQVASWLAFAPDPTHHTVTTSFSTAKIQNFVSSLGKSFNKTPQAEELGVAQGGGTPQVLQAGTNGQSLTNQAAISSGLVAALTAGKPFTVAATVATTPFSTQQMTLYPKWIEINLSKQTMTAYENATSVLHVLISSGIPMFPTPTGTYHILGKVASTEMKGDLGTPYAYDLPNVQWVSWWKSGGYAIHGTYWHHNFGHVMSHGCINATNADALFIYNWAPVGTPVVIHT